MYKRTRSQRDTTEHTTDRTSSERRQQSMSMSSPGSNQPSGYDPRAIVAARPQPQGCDGDSMWKPDCLLVYAPDATSEPNCSIPWRGSANENGRTQSWRLLDRRTLAELIDQDSRQVILFPTLDAARRMVEILCNLIVDTVPPADADAQRLHSPYLMAFETRTRPYPRFGSPRSGF